ncbi:hypothetical protein GP486_003721 [Trichoglossum hirsutum]|uniref:CRAL-TRIO domain-containing protein n=1 Tax=Trichoglossum hirsutum TaxID=265104 RepID=A0A9P8LCI8_9PEZI|nr:hypothetical protein GP486_003721 [Trichoglossum hirsutum]
MAEQTKPAPAADASHYDGYDYPAVKATPQNGHPGHTTPEQDDMVLELRELLEKEGFIDCETWRKEFKVDDLVRNFVYVEKPEVFKYYPQYYHKTDKDGRPVYIEAIGNIDLNAMYKITTAERMLSNLVVEYEKLADPRLPACSRKTGNLLETCCTIMDLKGVGLSKFGSVYSYLKQASAISQNYYPERLGKLYLINAPWGFSSVWAVIKGFLDPVTVDKIQVLGATYHAELLNQVPAENLPKEYGGECECDGGCMLSDMGPWQEPEWTRPPKWAQSDAAAAVAAAATTTTTAAGEEEQKQKQAPTTTIENAPTGIVTDPSAAPAEEGEKAINGAAAAAAGQATAPAGA